MGPNEEADGGAVKGSTETLIDEIVLGGFRALDGGADSPK